MGKGAMYRSELIKEKDKTTGVEVIRLTDNLGDTIHPYFTQPVMSNDGKVMIVESNRNGDWHLYGLEIETGRITQLSKDPLIGPHNSCLDPEGRIAYYWTGQTLKSVELCTLRTDLLYVLPDGFYPEIISISTEGKYLAFPYSERLSLSTGSDLENFFRRPHSIVIRLDLQEQRSEALWGETEWIGHVSISPVDPDLVMFCHEGSWPLVQRMWMVKADTHEVWPVIRQKRHLEAVGHEFFTRSGEIVAQYQSRNSPYDQFEDFNLMVRPDGSHLRKFRLPGPRPRHIQANSQATLFVGDKAYINKDFKEGADFLGLMEHTGDRAEVRLLCQHGNSWRGKLCDPHPFFAPDDRHVIFVSDREGRCNVYMAEVPEGEQSRSNKS